MAKSVKFLCYQFMGFDFKFLHIYRVEKFKSRNISYNRKNNVKSHADIENFQVCFGTSENGRFSEKSNNTDNHPND